MIVEFFDVPGPEKSTLARPFGEAPRKRGYRTVLPLNNNPAVGPRLLDLGRRIWFIMLYFCRAPRQCLRVIAASRSVQPKLPYFLRHCPGLLYMCALQHQYRRRQDIVVLDQGVAQGVYSLALLGPAASPAPSENVELLSGLLRALPKPDLLIKIDAAAGVLRERLNRRWELDGRRRWPRSRLELLSRTDSRAVEDSMRLILCIEEVVQCQGWKTIRCCTTEAEPVAQAAERLAQEVLSAELTQGRVQLVPTEASAAVLMAGGTLGVGRRDRA